MIQPPKRSVTRFFIPMIDVWTLLFCIFLLMPYVKQPADAGEPAGLANPEDPVALRAEVEWLKRDRERAFHQQTVCVLEVDRDSGKLYHREPERVEIRNQIDAAALIDREVKAAAGREAYFLILYPRELSGFPEQRQAAAYERWFAGVPHGVDNPRGRPRGGSR
jgi:hypothetical protein